MTIRILILEISMTTVNKETMKNQFIRRETLARVSKKAKKRRNSMSVRKLSKERIR